MLALFFATLVNLAWTAPASGPPPAGYRIYYGDASTAKTATVDVGNKTTHALDVDLAKVKFFTVRSYNEWGESPDAGEVVVGKPLAAQNLKVTP